jgi:glycosyltransferase involved in cell wall biosynthesis
VNGLAEAMSSLISDHGAARAMGEAGRLAFLDRFTTDHFQERLGAFYRRVLDGSSTHAYSGPDAH